MSGLPSGLRDLDAKTGGMHGSDLMIIAGRPAMGKTALATKIAFGAAQALVREAQAKGEGVQPRGTVAIFSLEMSADQLATRLLSKAPGFPATRSAAATSPSATSTASSRSAASSPSCRW